MILRTIARGALPLALLLPACAAAHKSDADLIREGVHHARYEQAVRRAAELSESHPGDAELARLHREASVAWLLEEGRQKTFQDQDLEALELFRRAHETDPESVEAASWIDKTLRKMSRTWLERALELHASSKLEQAVEAYGKALEYVPGDPSALNGLGEATIQINYRAGMGKEYFDEGLRALSRYWLEQAHSRFAYSGKYQPQDPKTVQRRSQVDTLLAQQRVTVAKGIEAKGRFGAAKNEYRLAAALDPASEEARTGLERCRSEAKAGELLAQARMEIVRGRFDKAKSLIEEGEALTVRQKEMFEGLRAQIEQVKFERRYEEALSLERDFQYEKAVEEYGELLKETEYFKDALARKGTLEEYIQLAGELYEKVQAAGSDEEKLDSLRKIRVFWPEYKDVGEQLRRLEKQP